MSADDLRTARRLLTAAIVALVLGAVLSLLDGVVDAVWGVGAAVGSLAVTWLCSWRAGRFMKAGLPYYLWKYLPAALLVGLPVAFRLVGLLRRDGGVVGPRELLAWARPFCAFVLPLALLLLADWSLRRLASRLGAGA
ncbi:hypothetical protein [Tautonia plasticadhaerens]|uniref:Uncharacterized protein n=1 Tax=Tautonia plasticadhaerens TaxID=2527974 RepID=A0A518GUG9_9BACT|nr:hypothetical protein [Tautonia plasticadhaerens]QDV32240.1 hypothetical protein ElP_00630 [Tautonia plasticadhaerens]